MIEYVDEEEIELAAALEIEVLSCRNIMTAARFNSRESLKLYLCIVTD